VRAASPAGSQRILESTEDWGARHGVVAGITRRDMGSFGFWTAEPVEQVMGRWRAFRDAQRPGFTSLVKAHQVHGTAVLWHRSLPPGWHVADAADGHATSDRGLLLAVSVADCVPVYLASRRGAVALLHAGWRGVAAGVLEAGLRVLENNAAVAPSEVAMHCGVGICGSCYEVDEQVARRVLGEAAKRGKQHLDLREALRLQAEAVGVREVTTSSFCTSCHRDRFYSHRASRGSDGRMVAYLGMALAPLA
jgi:YfiH family protein